jgi:molybdate transport system substrate-binding protein
MVMQSTLYRLILLGILAAILPASTQAGPREIENLTVLADSTISGPVSKLLLQFSRIEGAAVSGVFKTADSHLKIIEDGEPADVLITANQELIELLKGKGLIDVASPTVVARNKLVVLSSKSNPLKLENISLEDVLKSKHSWVVLDPALYPEGKTAINFLTSALSGTTWLPARNYKEATTMLDNSKSLGLLMPPTSGKSLVMYDTNQDKLVITYTAVVVASENMETARKLMRFLSSPEAGRIIEELGLKKP